MEKSVVLAQLTYASDKYTISIVERLRNVKARNCVFRPNEKNERIEENQPVEVG